MPADEAVALLAEVNARQEIAEVLYRYCRGVDRMDLDLFRSAYHSDATDDHGLYQGNVDGLLRWIEQRHLHIVQSMHFVGNVLIDLELDRDRAFMESYCTVTQRVSEDAGGWPSRGIRIGCRYLDHLERRAGRWAFASHVVVYEWWHEFDVSDVELGPTCQQALHSLGDPLYGPFGLGARDRRVADVRHG